MKISKKKPWQKLIYHILIQIDNEVMVEVVSNTTETPNKFCLISVVRTLLKYAHMR